MSSIDNFFFELNQINDIVRSSFEHNVLSGSSAIYYLIMKHPYFGNPNMRNSILAELGYNDSILPNDFDFIIVQNLDITQQRLGSYISEQSITSSKTFKSNDNSTRSFDLIKTQRISFFELDGINIIKPSILLSNYLDNARPKDLAKIQFLESIVDDFDMFDYENVCSKAKSSKSKLLDSDYDTDYDHSMSVNRKLF